MIATGLWLCDLHRSGAKNMDISKAIAALKKEPGFNENVGMILVHNGVVRGTRRADQAGVASLTIRVDKEKMQAICREYEQQPGIFRVVAESESGTYHPGDDLLFIIVAGDVRENVKPVLSEVLDRIKAETVSKDEHLAKP
jgi:molybdopterin synthase catalytic subunit